MKIFKPLLTFLLLFFSSIFISCEEDNKNQEEDTRNRIEFEGQIYPITRALQTCYGVTVTGSHYIMLGLLAGSDATLQLAMFSENNKLVVGNYTQSNSFAAGTFAEGTLLIQGRETKQIQSGKVVISLVDEVYTIFIDCVCENGAIIKAWYEGELAYTEGQIPEPPTECNCPGLCDCSNPCECVDACGCTYPCDCDNCDCDPNPQDIENLFVCEKGKYAIEGGVYIYKGINYGDNGYDIDNIDFTLYYKGEYELEIYFELFQDGGPHLMSGTYVFKDTPEDLTPFSILNYSFYLKESGKEYDLASEEGTLFIQKKEEEYIIQGEFILDNGTTSLISYQGTLEFHDYTKVEKQD